MSGRKGPRVEGSHNCLAGVAKVVETIRTYSGVKTVNIGPVIPKSCGGKMRISYRNTTQWNSAHFRASSSQGMQDIFVIFDPAVISQKTLVSQVSRLA